MSECINEEKCDDIREYDDDKHFQSEDIVKENCVTCIYKVKLYKHPNNKIEELKGSIMQECEVFGCSGLMELEGDDGMVILTNDRECCEMWEEKIK